MSKADDSRQTQNSCRTPVISTEWAGYLVFPLLWWLVRRLKTPLVAALPPLMLVALAIVEAVSGAHGLNLTYSGALARFFPEFVAGMAIVRLAAASHGAKGRSVAAAGLALAAASAAGAAPDCLVVVGFWCLLAGLYVIASGHGRTMLAQVPGLIFLGTISYSFYMSFAPVEMVQAFVWRRAGVAPAAAPAVYIATTTALTLALGLLAWRYIERPAHRQAGRWLGRAPALASAAQRG